MGRTPSEGMGPRVTVLGKIIQRHPQSAYASMGMLLQLKWHYLRSTVPELDTLMGPIEKALREKFFCTLFGGENITADFRKILGHIAKNGSLDIPDPIFQQRVHTTTTRQLVGNWYTLFYEVPPSTMYYIGHAYVGQV